MQKGIMWNSDENYKFTVRTGNCKVSLRLAHDHLNKTENKVNTISGLNISITPLVQNNVSVARSNLLIDIRHENHY